MNKIAFLNHTRLVLAEARAASRMLRKGSLVRKEMLALCRSLLGSTPPGNALDALWGLISPLPADQRYYWTGTLYTLLLPPAERKAQAAYFTPPNLARGLMDMLQAEGFDPKVHTAIDPAAGGASFLSTIAGVMLDAGLDAKTALDRLSGFEIDPALAHLSELLVGDRLGQKVSKGTLVQVKNSLRARPRTKYDLVIANPPYGRLSTSDLPDERWREVCQPGHINKYALFTELCFRLAKPDGLIALVLPSSFVAGPFYGRLRAFIRSRGALISLSQVAMRDDVFIDVAQDVSVMVIRAGQAHAATRLVAFGSYTTGFTKIASLLLPPAVEDPWISNATASPLEQGGATLTDYGATLKAGYFVWNREKKRMHNRTYGKFDVPLIWAKNIQAGQLCVPAARKRNGIDFVRFRADSAAIIRSEALVMQRTTNSAQTRRLIAARVGPSVVATWRGFVSENHTITITGVSGELLAPLTLLLNSAAVDARYRQLSGTASVSVTLLRKLDLPKPASLIAAIKTHGPCEAAVEEAYRLSIPPTKVASQ